MIEGEFRDGHPRIELTLKGASGSVAFSFIVDTGFEGGLALPARFANQLRVSPTGMVDRALANGAIVKVPVLEVAVVWDGKFRYTELLVLEGNPLVGTDFLMDNLLTVEIASGGAVVQ